MLSKLRKHPCQHWYTGAYTALEGVRLLKEYLDLAEQYPTPMRMIRGHTFSLIGQPPTALLTKLCHVEPHNLLVSIL